MKWLKPRPSKKAIAALAAVVLGQVGVGAVLFVQQQAALARATGVLNAKKTQLEEGSRLASRLATTDEELGRDRQRLKNLETGVPDAGYIPTLLRQVEKLARDTSNTVRAVRPQLEVTPTPTKIQRRTDPEADEKAAKNPETKTAPSEPYNRLHIQLTLTGTYANSQRFIQQLTQFPKIVSVDGVTLHPRPVEGPGGQPMLDIEMNLTAFIMKQGPVPGSIPTGNAPAGAEEA
jgi:Tfp pilus assembly protein PilO